MSATPSGGPVLGIDLGTTNSVVAVTDGEHARVISDPEGNRLIPSCVSFTPEGTVLVGHAARERRLVDAENTVYSVKRLIGRPFTSPEVQRARERFAFAIEPSRTGGVQIRVRKGTYALPELSAYVLRHLREVAEAALGTECRRAVITVPANFNELQRSATQAAGKVAGLDVLRIIHEPTAATLAYGYGQGRPETIAVYDFGGGTFDVTILDLDRDVFEVVSTAGDTFLGGDDIDLAITELMVEACLREHGFDAREEPQAFERMRAAAEWAKCQLSSVSEAELTLEELFVKTGFLGRKLGTVDFTFRITKDELEERMRPLIARTLAVVDEALREAGRRPREIDNVVLVGGSTRVPLVRRMVEEYFGRPPRADIDPDLVVAQGAAIHAWNLAGRPTASAAPPARPSPHKRTLLLGPRERDEARPKQPAFAPSPAPVKVPRPGAPLVPPPSSVLGLPEPATRATTPRPGTPARGISAAPTRTVGTAADGPPAGPPSSGPPSSGALSSGALSSGALSSGVASSGVASSGVASSGAASSGVASSGVASSGVASSRAASSGAASSATPSPSAASPIAPTLGTSLDPVDRPSLELGPVAVLAPPARIGTRQDSGLLDLDDPLAHGPATPSGGASRDASVATRRPIEVSVPAPIDAPFAEPRARPLVAAGVDAPFGLSDEAPKKLRRDRTMPFGVGVAADIDDPFAAPAARPTGGGASRIDALDAPVALPDPAAPAAPTPSRVERSARPSLTDDLFEVELESIPPEPIDSIPPEALAPDPLTRAAPPPPPLPPPPRRPPAPPAPPPPARPAAAPPAPPSRAAEPDLFDHPDLFEAAASAALEPSDPFAPSGPVQDPALAPHIPVLQIRGGDGPHPLLMDVTPLTLSLETAGGFCAPVVPRNAPVPAEKSRIFSTARDDQDAVELRICQGEAARFEDNELLGTLVLDGLRKARRGEVRVEVTFLLDASGILDVRATDLDTGRAQHTRIQLQGGIDAAEIEAMRRRQESELA